MRKTSIITAAVIALTLATASAALADGPTCSDVLPIANHGQHVVGDYVAGVGHEALAWPPNGEVGGGPAALPGGPGPGFHFGEEIPPGASFCTGANSGVVYTNPSNP